MGISMDISNKKIWQVAAGDANRNYADFCLAWGVILIGPGAAGPWPACQEGFNKAGISGKKISDIRRFAEGISDNDIVVLKVGTTDVYGVGIVKGEYQHCLEFGDVDGWDLEHVRRVKWVWKYQKTQKHLILMS